MNHERPPKTDEWFTPEYIFTALNVVFDLDVCGDPDNHHQCVPAKSSISDDSLRKEWDGFVWMNPPFGGRNEITPWLDKFSRHRNGICLTPDRTSAPWWQKIANNADTIVFVSPKIRFIDSDGNKGASPSVGTTLFGIGARAEWALNNSRLGFMTINNNIKSTPEINMDDMFR